MLFLRWDSLSNRRTAAKLQLLYMMLRKFSPTYLSELVELLPLNVYTTRQHTSNNLTVLIHSFRLSGGVRSFIPSTSRIWNTLPDEIRTSDSQFKFKVGVKKHYKFFNPDILHNNYHKHHFGKLNKILLQIFLGISPLSGQLFKSNLSDNPFCPECFDEVETSKHYFFECTKYAQIRIVLVNEVNNCYAHFVKDYLDLKLKLPDVLTAASTLQLILSGFEPDLFARCKISFSPEQYYYHNRSLHTAVLKFMYDSNRFIAKPV